MKKRNMHTIALLTLITATMCSFTACSKTESGESKTVQSETPAAPVVKSDKDRILEASAAGKIGNWGLGNEYEILALLAKYDRPLEFLSQDFTMDGFDDNSISLASAMTYNELGLVKNDYDGAYGYGERVLAPLI